MNEKDLSIAYTDLNPIMCLKFIEDALAISTKKCRMFMKYL